VERRGSSGGGYLHGKRGLLGSVWTVCLLLFCKMVWLIGGCGSSIRLIATRLNQDILT
jgi:hypothetical protein